MDCSLRSQWGGLAKAQRRGDGLFASLSMDCPLIFTNWANYANFIVRGAIKGGLDKAQYINNQTFAAWQLSER